MIPTGLLPQGPVLPKLPGQFAEFLCRTSLIRLATLAAVDQSWTDTISRSPLFLAAATGQVSLGRCSRSCGFSALDTPLRAVLSDRFTRSALRTLRNSSTFGAWFPPDGSLAASAREFQVFVTHACIVNSKCTSPSHDGPFAMEQSLTPRTPTSPPAHEDTGSGNRFSLDTSSGHEYYIGEQLRTLQMMTAARSTFQSSWHSHSLSYTQRLLRALTKYSGLFPSRP